MKNNSTNSVIPEGELRCVWMDAGITEFKLCDQEFRCETCTFNENVTLQNKEKPFSRGEREAQLSSDNMAMTTDAYFHKVLKQRLDYLRTVNIPQDRIYTRGQFWIQQEAEGNYRIGINHILANFFQPVLSIVFSKAPTNIHRHDPFCWIIMPGGAITLRSPIEATITNFNPALKQKPSLLSTSTFENGWIVEITAKSKILNGFTSLPDSQRLMKQTLHNVEHLFNQTFQHLHPSIGTTLFDGGISLGNIERILGPIIYKEVVNRITHFPS